MLRLLLLPAPFLAQRTLAACGCGYAINTRPSSTTSEQTIFTQSLQTDFTRTEDVTWDSSPGPNWRVQAYNVTPAASRGPYGKAADVRNVVWSQLPPGSSGGQGVHGGDPGLQLWVRSQRMSDDDDSSGQMVPMAEVVSTRNDILYGSFRASMMSTAVSGTCAGFFFYHNDSQEIDMEILSRQTQDVDQGGWKINLINQSPASVLSGYNAANTSGFGVYGLSFNPAGVYAEYRFDWLPDRIDFYIDGILAWNITDSVPTSPGAIHLIHWSNGDPGWSAGPPEQDAVLTVSYVHAFFNSSEDGTKPMGAPCDDTTCSVPDGLGSPPQPNVPDPNATGLATSTSSTSTPTQRSETSNLLSSIPLLWCVIVGLELLNDGWL